MYRHPIVINKNAIALIQIFTRQDSWEDIPFLEDLDDRFEYEEYYKNMAKQFIDQLEGKYCVAFLDALKKECDVRIKKHTNK